MIWKDINLILIVDYITLTLRTSIDNKLMIRLIQRGFGTKLTCWTFKIKDLHDDTAIPRKLAIKEIEAACI